MARNTPVIRAGVLILESPTGGRLTQVPPESDAWFRWLESARTFTFEDSSGRFTARKRRRSGADYWYAFRRGSGQLYEIYLGKARDITLGRLHTALLNLNRRVTVASDRRTVLSGASIEALPAAEGDRDGSSSLVTTLGVPQVRVSQMVHTSAVDRLARIAECALTVVTSPAGYGKTTALAQVIATLRVPAVWVTLNRRDNDPARFWAEVCAALERVIPDTLETGRVTNTVQDASDADRVLATLSAPLPVVSTPLLVVLDDYHELHAESRVIHDAVAFLAEHLSPQVHLVIASRTVPPLPLAKLRARDQLLELSAADLRFTLPETRALLHARTALHLTDEEVAVLHERTEGWVSALQLAALSLGGQPDPRAWIAEFSGENRYIFDYLAEEVIKQIPSRLYDFALRVAVLDRLSAPLCDAVTSTTDSQAMLEEMERYNLFLVPLDDRRGWYRFHPLFADVLRRTLRQTQPSLVPLLYARASAWCEADRRPLDAIDYAFEAHELEVVHTAQLVEAYVPTALARGYFLLLRERLERLPDRLVRDRPRLAVAHAYTLFMTGERRLWLQRIREAEEAFARTADPLDASERELVGAEILALRSAARLTLAEVSPAAATAALRLAQAVLPLEHVFQSVITLYLGIGQLLDADVRAARQTFDDLTRSSEAIGNWFHIAYTLLLHGTVMRTLGRLDDALALSERAARRLEGFGDANLEALARVLRGRVLYERNDLERALVDLEYGASSLRYNRGTYLMEFAPALAYTHLALGNAAAANLAIEAAFTEWAEAQSANRPLLVWTGRHIRAHHARLLLLEGDVEAAAVWAREREASGDAPAVGVAEQSPFVREWEEIVLSRLYLAEGRASDALALLERLGAAAHAGERVARLLEVLILRAVACDALDDSVAALEALRQALVLGRPQRFVRAFVEGGPAIQRLLTLLLGEPPPPKGRARPHATAALRPYVMSLLDAMPPDERGEGDRRARRPPRRHAGNDVAGPPTPELTVQQRAIIRLIAAGLSNKEIAEKLVISEMTVKRHASNVYARLDVHNRTQAVARARALGFLSTDDPFNSPSATDL